MTGGDECPVAFEVAAGGGSAEASLSRRRIANGRGRRNLPVSRFGGQTGLAAFRNFH
jgi:hypothetical protein